MQSRWPHAEFRGKRLQMKAETKSCRQSKPKQSLTGNESRNKVLQAITAETKSYRQSKPKQSLTGNQSRKATMRFYSRIRSDGFPVFPELCWAGPFPLFDLHRFYSFLLFCVCACACACVCVCVCVCVCESERERERTRTRKLYFARFVV